MIRIRLGGKWVPIPLPYYQAQQGPVWHYTSWAAVVSILSTDELWATIPIVLNDASELEHGLGVLRECWEELRNDLPTNDAGEFLTTFLLEDLSIAIELAARNTFILCGSLDGDSLSQWRSYAGSCGHLLPSLDDALTDRLGETIEQAAGSS